MKRECKTCVFWRADETEDFPTVAPCVLKAMITMFNYNCNQWIYWETGYLGYPEYIHVTASARIH